MYLITILMYTVFSPDPIYNRGGGQLPNPDKCNSTLTSGTRGEVLTSNLNEWNWPPPILYKLGKGVNYLTLMSAILC